MQKLLGHPLKLGKLRICARAMWEIWTVRDTISNAWYIMGYWTFVHTFIENKLNFQVSKEMICIVRLNLQLRSNENWDRLKSFFLNYGQQFIKPIIWCIGTAYMQPGEAAYEINPKYVGWRSKHFDLDSAVESVFMLKG